LHHYTDALIGNSAAITDFLAERFPFLPKSKLHQVWNAVEPPDTSNSQLRRELQLGDAPLILAVGGLSANKRHQVLLEALALMQDRAAHVVVAGWGAQAEFLQQRTNELGLGQRVHWLGHRQDVPKLLGAANVFVLTSQHEGSSTALLEAMAAGLPVVSTPVAGTEIVLAPVAGRPHSGWLVPFDDPPALAATLDLVLRKSGGGEVQERTREALWRTQHWFGVDRMVAGYEAVLAGQPVPNPQ
jgi:glycosyltransferase involved in cell wall biosynthesis